MDFSIKTFDTKNTIISTKPGCLVVGVYENKKLSQAAIALDHRGAISAVLKSGDITGKAGTSLLLRGVEGVAAERVLLVGLGETAPISEKSFTTAIQTICRVFSTIGANDAIIALPVEEVKERDVKWAVHTVVLAMHESVYRCDQLKSKRDPDPRVPKKIAIAVPASRAAAAKTSQATSLAIAHGINLTKELGNMPANLCTPGYLVKAAEKIAKEFKMPLEVLDRKQIEALKMNSFLSVTNGSEEPPKFIVIKHNGGKDKDAPTVLVGKGVTFDSGGISLKPGGGMDEMKYDMCGAATVLGTFRAIGEMNLKLNVIGIIAACENMPSGRATKPGDVITSMSGLTIEVLNTDAEGRLILCDALSYAERFKPAVVIDIATLTGACVVSLGHHNSGLFTRHDEEHDKLAAELLSAGKSCGDTAWRMPVEDAYQEQLKSNFADVTNMGTPGGGSVVAACFLERFTKKYTWAHLDIAGTAWKSGGNKGATGRPVPLLTTFLINRAG